MAIAFPRTLPAVGFSSVDPVLDLGVVAAKAGRRRINYTQISDPTWTISLTTQSLAYSDYAALEAWWLSLRDGLRTVLFQNPNICFPKAHGRNQAPAEQAGMLSAIEGGNRLTVTGVDPALTLSVGDYIGLERAGVYYLGRVVEVSGANTSRQIEVEPPPLGSVAQPGGTVHFVRPPLMTRPVPGSWSKQQSGSRTVASFQLVEV